jgi:hypothetical protein
MQRNQSLLPTMLRHCMPRCRVAHRTSRVVGVQMVYPPYYSHLSSPSPPAHTLQVHTLPDRWVVRHQHT